MQSEISVKWGKGVAKLYTTTAMGVVLIIIMFWARAHLQIECAVYIGMIVVYNIQGRKNQGGWRAVVPWSHTTYSHPTEYKRCISSIQHSLIFEGGWESWLFHSRVSSSAVQYTDNYFNARSSPKDLELESGPSCKSLKRICQKLESDSSVRWCSWASKCSMYIIIIDSMY